MSQDDWEKAKELAKKMTDDEAKKHLAEFLNTTPQKIEQDIQKRMETYKIQSTNEHLSEQSLVLQALRIKYTGSSKLIHKALNGLITVEMLGLPFLFICAAVPLVVLAASIRLFKKIKQSGKR